jgi:hypothetical protein
VHGIYEREGRDLPGGPWAFRDAAGATGETSRLVDMERGALSAMTSCGWFFDDIAGIEARQVLRYAARAIALAGPESARLEAGFIERLGDERNVEVFRQTLQPTPS